MLIFDNQIDILQYSVQAWHRSPFQNRRSRSTFWREISDSPAPISAEYGYDARRCLPILRQNEFPTFTIREQTYTFPCVSICTANIAILFEIYNSARRFGNCDRRTSVKHDVETKSGQDTISPLLIPEPDGSGSTHPLFRTAFSPAVAENKNFQYI